MLNRVIYTHSNDLAFAMNLDRIETLIIPDSIGQITINDAIEFYEIKRYIVDDGVVLKKWTPEEVENYKEKSRQLFKITNQFFRSINDESILFHFKSLDKLYLNSFWILFDLDRLYDIISDEIFSILINSPKTHLLDILTFSRISSRYGQVIRDYAFQNYEIVSVLVFAYGQNNENREKVFIPKEITGDDINDILLRYIESKNPNINTLELISNTSMLAAYKISDMVRYKAKQRANGKIEELFSNEDAVSNLSVRLEISPNLKKEKDVKFDREKIEITLSSKWLEETLDFPSIMNNFIYLFEFVDNPQMRSSFVSKKRGLCIIDEIRLMTDSSRLYLDSLNFKINDDLLRIEMDAYYQFLRVRHIRLEDVLKWVFTEYLQLEFSFPEMRLVFPSEQTSYVEKCTSLLAVLDSLAKQYTAYAEYGEINFELISMSSAPVSFSSIPSIVKEKYLYGKGREYESITYLLFSGQCSLSYIDRVGDKYDSFFDLITHEQIFRTDYAECYNREFDYLESRNLIRINKDGQIVINDMKSAYILRDLFFNDVISMHHYPKDFLQAMRKLEEKGIVFIQSTLFSKPESQYLNYQLNKSEFDNGPEIRNKYMHGIQQSNNDDNFHYNNYLIILSIIILFAIKINDDLQIADKISGSMQFSEESR